MFGSLISPAGNMICGAMAMFVSYWRHVKTYPASIESDGTPWAGKYGAEF